jgi:saccharopine dehydrogenase (NADP+, L-glutamate forming)
MISVSYENSRLRDLEQDALRRDVLLLTEMGLDPGIDHMSAMSLIHQVRDRGGRIKGFTSYGSGIPAPDSISNPFKYVITWNPRNVVMAGNVGAQYLEKGKIKIVPYSRVFSQTWPVEVPGVGTLEAYPNRDSLGYLETFGLEHAETIIRGTLRYPGWSETWSQIVRLGLPNEDMRIPNLHELTYRQVLEMFLPLNLTESTPAAFRTRVAKLLGISPTGSIMEKLDWLGLFSDEKIPCERCQTAAEMLEELLTRKLPLLQAGRDMVVLQHTLQVEEEDGSRSRLRSTLVAYGERDGFTAMAKTVGLPPGIAVKLLLSGELPQRGCQIPIHPAIYQPILKELEQEGISFVEEELPWED